MKVKYLLFFLVCLAINLLQGQSSTNLPAPSLLWQEVVVAEKYKSVGAAQPDKLPAVARTMKLAPVKMQKLLWKAPYADQKASEIEVSVPSQLGGFETFAVFRKRDVFAKNLMDQYGETIRSFSGHKVGDTQSVIHLTMGYGRFNAAIYRSGGVVDFVEYAAVLKDDTYLIYRRGEVDYKKIACHFDESLVAAPPKKGKSLAPTSQVSYRLQMTTSGSFSEQFGDGTPTKPEIQAIITSQISDILNPAFNRDFGVVLLNATNDASVFLTNGANTPFSDESSALAVLYENAVFCNDGETSAFAGIDKADFDVGHAQVYVNSGGVAQGFSVCDEGTETVPAGFSVTGEDAVYKAQAMSGIPYPLLNDFTIDYVAHEIGHQFGCSHVYATVEASGSGCSTGSTNNRYETGSGTSIMSYANVCSDPSRYPDGKTRSDPFFHARSIDQAAFAMSFFSCGAVTASTNTDDPVATASVSTLTIPQGTPFALVGDVSDTEGSVIANWNQFDLAANDYDGGDFDSDSPSAGGPPMSTNTSGPLFRFLTPVAAAAGKATRIFPDNALTKGTQAWEVLPTVARSMVFRLMARDNQIGAGQFGRTNDATTAITVTGDGPLAISAPTTGTILGQGEDYSISYSGLPSGICASVDVFLSTDGGTTYLPTPIALNVVNNGSISVTIPGDAPATSNARVLVQCHTTSGTLLGSSTAFQVSEVFTIEEVVLPVTLVSLSAQAIEKVNLVAWVTSTELDNEGFIVQRSSNGSDWTNLGFVGGNNGTTLQAYDWVDDTPLNGINYYRLLIRAFDGTEEVSKVVSVRQDAQGEAFTIFPNPSEGRFAVNFTGGDLTERRSIDVQVYNASGQLVYQNNSDNPVQIVDMRRMAKGVYYLRGAYGDKVSVRKLLLQ